MDIDGDFDLDAMELGLALGFGEEVAEAEIEQRIAQENFDKETERSDKSPESVSIKERVDVRDPKKSPRYYDPFLHYAFEVNAGVREPDDYSGILFNYEELIERGPDENGDWPWQTSK